ncbi:MAG: TIGR03084 family metal-binding protein [Haloechinothrix sp.]
MADLRLILDDLDAEGDELDLIVAGLDDESWSMATPADGWTIAHQIAHLAWTDEKALLAVTGPDRFRAEIAVAMKDPAGFVDEGAAEGTLVEPADLVDRWRAGRAALHAALAAVPDGEKLPWYGPPMGASSMATARIMETWAHGQDVADTLGVVRASSDRLRHVAHIGVRTRDFAYAVNQLPAPSEPFRIELTGPEGDLWTWGPEAAPQRVTGPALDFCLLVTQRRHRDDTDVRAEGSDADQWLDIAQAFAGSPGGGRKAAQFRKAGQSS